LLEAEEGRNWRQGKVPAFIGMWWFAFITSSVLVVVGWDLWGDANSYSDIKLAAMIEVTGNAIAVLSGVLAYVVVDRASERQQARAMRVAIWRPLAAQV
jgi:hypothetical protein